MSEETKKPPAHEVIMTRIEELTVELNGFDPDDQMDAPPRMVGLNEQLGTLVRMFVPKEHVRPIIDQLRAFAHGCTNGLARFALSKAADRLAKEEE